jgi:homeobox protein Meis2
MEDIAQHFGLGASGHGHQHHHNQLPWGSSPLSAVVAPPPPSQQQQPSGGYLAHSPLSLNTAPSGGNHSVSNPVLQLANGSLLEACAKAAKDPSSSSYAVDVDAIKAKIISHPHYSSLLAAYLDCQKASDSSTTTANSSTAAPASAQEVSLLHLMSNMKHACFACLFIEATVHQMHIIRKLVLIPSWL